jgi:hypothetical protein
VALYISLEKRKFSISFINNLIESMDNSFMFIIVALVAFLASVTSSYPIATYNSQRNARRVIFPDQMEALRSATDVPFELVTNAVTEEDILELLQTRIAGGTNNVYHFATAGQSRIKHGYPQRRRPRKRCLQWIKTKYLGWKCAKLS